MIPEHRMSFDLFLFLPGTSSISSTSGMCSVNERQRYDVTPSLIGSDHTQNDPVHTLIPLTDEF